MPKVSRKFDIASGHGCFPPSPATGGSANVMINGIPALRKGDSVLLHGCSNCPPHGRSVSAGSPSVYVNKKPVARIGDSISCGGSVAAGSSNVYANG